MRSQIVTSKEGRDGRRYMPYAFTEQGVAMLPAVLRSDTAIQVSIRIINAFVEMRRFIANNAALFERIRAEDIFRWTNLRRLRTFDFTDSESLERNCANRWICGYWHVEYSRDKGRGEKVLRNYSDSG